MKIGIGITTCNRPHLLDQCIWAIEANTSKPYSLHIQDDTHTRNGVAFSKNACLFALRDCDLIFLFDDDCFPTSPGWVDFFVQAHEATGQHHFLFMSRERHKYSRTWQPFHGSPAIDLYEDCAGVFMSITRRAFETIGYFDDRYHKYGYEHAGYSRRLHLSRLNASPFMCVAETSQYLRALDFEGDIPSSISDEEKQSHIPHNETIYHTELKEWDQLYRQYNG